MGQKILAVVLFGLLIGIQPVAANYSVEIKITDAKYGDFPETLEGTPDGQEDDIQIDLSLTLTNNRRRTNIDLYIGVELPSGTEYWFKADLVVRKSEDTATFNLRFFLIDTATESGDYVAKAVGFASGDRFSTMDIYIFDPPGSVTAPPPPTGYGLVL